jgi:HK97 gp10 family phage protein
MTVTGAEAVARKFLIAATAVQKAVPDALDKAALLVTRSAKQKAPVDTGALRGLIKPERVSAKEADVVSPAEYSIYQEVGTYKMPAHPYMRPALDENAEAIKELIGDAALSAVGGAMGGLATMHRAARGRYTQRGWRK